MLDLTATVPPVLRARCAMLGVADPSGAAPAGEVVSDAMVADALRRFTAGFWQPDPAAAASLWSMFYLDAVFAPAVAALLCCDRALPTALGAVRLVLDDRGLPARVLLADGDRPACEPRFAALLHDQLEPFINRFAGQTGVPRLVLWSNAAVLLDYVVEAVGPDAVPAARAEALALLAGAPDGGVADGGAADGGAADGGGLALPFRETADGGRERRVCCGRSRLSGVAPCPTICPGRNATLGWARDGTTLARGGRTL